MNKKLGKEADREFSYEDIKLFCQSDRTMCRKSRTTESLIAF